jgi:multisubunit Na+/H+ antiporter MnhC subunit
MIKLYNYLVKSGDAIAVGVSGILFVIFALGIYFGTTSGGYTLSELIEKDDLTDVNCFNSGLWMMIVMTILAILLMIAGVFVDLFSNFKAGSKTIIGFGLMAVAFIVLYFTSSHDSGGRYAAYWSNPEFHINESISKFISAGLYTVMGLTLVSFLLILFYEVKSFFK